MGVHIWKAGGNLCRKRLGAPELPWSPEGGPGVDARGDAQGTALKQVLGLQPDNWPPWVPLFAWGPLTGPLGLLCGNGAGREK